MVPGTADRGRPWWRWRLWWWRCVVSCLHPRHRDPSATSEQGPQSSRPPGRPGPAESPIRSSASSSLLWGDGRRSAACALGRAASCRARGDTVVGSGAGRRAGPGDGARGRAPLRHGLAALARGVGACLRRHAAVADPPPARDARPRLRSADGGRGRASAGRGAVQRPRRHRRRAAAGLLVGSLGQWTGCGGGQLLPARWRTWLESRSTTPAAPRCSSGSGR